MLLYWQHLICTHFWGWIHFLSNVSTPILFSKRSKNLTRTPFFHPTLTQFPGSPVAPIHFLHIFKMDGLDVANSLARTESRYLDPLGGFRALEKKLFFDKKAADKICKFTRLWLNFSYFFTLIFNFSKFFQY